MSKVKYSVTPLQDQKALDALLILYDLQQSLKAKEEEIIHPKDFEKQVIKPLEKLFLSRIEKSPRPKATNPLEKEKDVSSTFLKIYDKLERKGADLSDIEKAKEKEKASQITAYKMMNIYVKHFDLKQGKKLKEFYLDDFLKGCFDDKILNELYEKTNSEKITQGSLNKLASFLLIKN